MQGSPIRYIIIATVLLIAGACLPFLILIRLLPSTFFLNFLAYGCMIVGIMIGFYGISGLVSDRRNRDNWEDWRDL